MNNYFQTTVITSVIIHLIINLNNKNVQGNPLTGYENKAILSRIFTDESWIKPHETEYQPKNTWIREMTNNNNLNNKGDCKGSKTCGAGTFDSPIKRDVFVSRGWGAGGMPFNVLYMKNPNRSNKSLRSSSSIIAEPLRYQPMPQAQQQFIPSNVINNINEMRDPSTSDITSQSEQNVKITAESDNNNPNNNHSKSKGPSSMLVPARRRYSIIPQLFVSYGWGPIGK